MLVSTNTHHPEGQGVVRGQSVTYFASAACSGGILAGGGPFLGGSCRLSGVSLNCTGKVVACIMTYVHNAATWRTLKYLYTKYDTEAMVTTCTQPVWCNSTHTECRDMPAHCAAASYHNVPPPPPPPPQMKEMHLLTLFISFTNCWPSFRTFLLFRW